jgi:CDP-glycerol glycerophosphotransferase (TagB/SpsB family)
MRSGVYFVNDNASDVNFSLANGAIIFNLWHGVGLKNVLYGANVGTSADLRRRGNRPFYRVRNMRRLQRPHWVLSTSSAMSKSFFSRCFDVPVDRAPALGYPRLDAEVDERLKRAALDCEDYSALHACSAGKRAILYAPTLREVDTGLLARALPDLQRLSRSLRQQDAHLFIKLHPKMAADANWCASLPPNITILPGAMDLYPILDRFAALVTDYSSLFFDFIAVRSSGVLLYPFDLEDYVRTERDMAWDYDDATSGTRAKDFDQLCMAVADGSVFAPLDPVRLQELRVRFWGGDLSRQTACERIRDFIMSRERAR